MIIPRRSRSTRSPSAPLGSAFALFALTAALARTTPAAAEGPLTLEDAVKLALANNERALKAPLRVEAAEGQLERARAAFLPTLTAGGTGTLAAQPDRNGRILAGTGQVAVNQPIISLPAFPLYAQARHQLESERWGAVEDRRVLSFDAAKAYLLAVAGERLVGTAQRRLDRAHAAEQDAASRAEAGLTSVNDVTRSKIDTSTAENQLAQAKGSLDRAYLQLAFLVARPVAGPLTPPQQTSAAAQRGQWRMDDVLRAAEARRADVRSSHERTEALRAFAEEPMFRLAPTVGASFIVHTTVDPVAPTPAHDESGVLTLTWTIYDGGARYADRKTRTAQAESQALDERALRRSIGTDVGVAIAALRTAREGYRISEDAVTAATKSAEETAILYRQGLARAIEVTDANASQYDAEVNLEAAKLAMEQGYLDLRQALGLDPIRGEIVPQGGAR